MIIMPRTYKNPFGDEKFLSVNALESYVKKYHKNEIPKEYKGDLEHYLFDYRNDFKGGKCQICGAPTEWDKSTKRYKVLCEPISIRKIAKDPYRTIKTFIKNKGLLGVKVVNKAVGDIKPLYKEAVIIFNANDEDVKIKLPEGEYKVLLDSDSFGKEVSDKVLTGEIEVQGSSAVFLGKK